MMSAPSEMRCKVTPIRSSTTKVAASTRGMVMDTTRPARAPSEMKLTRSTMATASPSASVKPPTACSTIRGWSDTRWMPTPTGSVASTSRILALRSRPKSRRLPPWRMAMARPTAGSPL